MDIHTTENSLTVKRCVTGEKLAGKRRNSFKLTMHAFQILIKALIHLKNVLGKVMGLPQWGFMCIQDQCVVRWMIRTRMKK